MRVIVVLAELSNSVSEGAAEVRHVEHRATLSATRRPALRASEELGDLPRREETLAHAVGASSSETGSRWRARLSTCSNGWPSRSRPSFRPTDSATTARRSRRPMREKRDRRRSLPAGAFRQRLAEQRPSARRSDLCAFGVRVRVRGDRVPTRAQLLGCGRVLHDDGRRHHRRGVGVVLRVRRRHTFGRLPVVRGIAEHVWRRCMSLRRETVGLGSSCARGSRDRGEHCEPRGSPPCGS